MTGRPPEIRVANADDLPALADVFRRASWSNEGDRELLTAHPEFLELDSAPIGEGRTRVAVSDGDVVGFASTESRGDAFELVDLFVVPERRREGVGRALVEDAVGLAARAGALRIDVDGNDHALDFYLAAGFSEVGVVQLDHGTAHRMTRLLRPGGSLQRQVP